MVLDINQTYCGDRFTKYTRIESLCCSLETNIMSMSIILQFKNNIKINLKKVDIVFYISTSTAEAWYPSHP